MHYLLKVKISRDAIENPWLVTVGGTEASSEKNRQASKLESEMVAQNYNQ